MSIEQKKFLACLLLFVGAILILNSAEAAVPRTGSLIYGDTTNQGTPKISKYSSDSDTAGAEFSGPATATASSSWTQAVTAPTRNEIMFGQLKNSNRLDIIRCVNDCDATGDASIALTFLNVGTSTAKACDVTFGRCYRPFDLAYEQLSGRLMVVYASSSNTGTVFHRIWDGSSWTATTSVTVTGSATHINWIRLVSRDRSNDLLLVVGDNNSDIFASVWTGSSFGSFTTITTTGSTPNSQNFDGAWEGATGNALVAWAEGTTATTTPYRYKRWTRSSESWAGSASVLTPAQTTATNGVSIGHWIKMAGAPDISTNYIAIIGQACTTAGCTAATGVSVPWIWNGTIASTTKGNEWGTIEDSKYRLIDVAWENATATPKAVFVGSTDSTADVSGFQTWINGTFGSITDWGGAMADDAEGIRLISYPNSNNMVATGHSLDDTLHYGRWNGAATVSWSASLESSLAPLPGTNTHGPEQHNYDFAPIAYSPWSMNWRWGNGTSTANTPEFRAAENTTTTDILSSGDKLRLRFNMVNFGGASSTDARKILQFTTSSLDTLDYATTTWTDVGNPASGSVWRYVDCDSGSTVCDDGVVMSARALASSTGAGWWVLNGTSAASTTMDHNATNAATTTVRELEFPIESNGAAGSTTYFFRMYDKDQLAPVWRFQGSGQPAATVCASATACRYPSLTTAPPAVLNQAQYRWYNNIASSTPTSSLAALNTSTTIGSWEVGRLRMNVGVTGSALPTGQTYKLQYATST